MSSWPLIAVGLNTHCVRAFGEPVRLLERGEEIVGAFYPLGRPEREANWDAGVGVAASLARTTNPALTIHDGTALEPRELVEVRGVLYEVVSVARDGTGLSWVDLMPVPER